MIKTAVDNVAKKYWETYFSEYGQVWVRSIPRRIKSELQREFKASKIDGNVCPLAYEKADDGTLSVEAAFSGTIDNKAAKILVTAEFNEDGLLVKCDPTRIS